MKSQTLRSQLQEIYVTLPKKTIMLSNKTTEIFELLYNGAVQSQIYDDNLDFCYKHASKVKKYIVYYDIGKSILPVEFAENDNLSGERLEFYKSHVARGIKILEEIFDDGLEMTRENAIGYSILISAIADHHERYDGGGYPQGLVGEDIAPIGRLLAAAELIAKKLLEGATKRDIDVLLKQESGKALDPRIIKLCRNTVTEFFATKREKAEKSHRQEFRAVGLLYNTIYDCEYNTSPACEAVICINDETHGCILPQVYLPVAEKSQRIVELTKLGLDQLCEKLSNNQLYGEKSAEFVVFNVSKRCIDRHDFPDMVFTYIKKYGINPRAIVLSVTESSLACHSAYFEGNIKRLRDMGIRFAISEYGKEYSSFSNFNNLDFDFLMLDKSFVEEICVNKRVYEIIKSISNMSAQLKFKLIADGVDTPEQKNALLALGCKYMQFSNQKAVNS